MAATIASLTAKVSIEGVDKAKADLQETGKAADQTQQSFGQMMKQGLANAASFAVFNVGAKAVNFLKDQMVDTIQVAIQHQDVLAQTAQVIKSTGGAAGLSANQISDLASSLSKVTAFSQDTTEQGENLLLTFTGIGKDVFPMATKTMLDMSQAMGQDVKSSAIQLGKALNDPAQGLTALTRVGVTFTDKQKEMIQQMVAAGNTAGAQKIMLEELQREFGGSAEAAGKTFGGQLSILQNKLTDVKQSIGTALMPILSQLVTNVSGMVMPAIQNFANFLQSNAFQNFASGVGKQMGDILSKIGTVVKNDVMPAIGGFASYLQSPGFQKFASDIGKKIGDVLSTIGDIVKNDVMPVVNDFLNVLKSPQFQSFIASVADLATKLTSALKPAMDNDKTIIEALLNFIKNTGLPAMSGLANGLSSVIGWFQKGGPIADTLKVALVGVAAGIAAMKINDFIGTLPKLFAGLSTWAVEQGAVALETLLTALPYIAIGALIAIVVAGIILAIQHWGEISKWLTDQWHNVQVFMGNLWRNIQGIFGGIGQWFRDKWQSVVDGFHSVLGGLGAAASGIFNSVTGAVKAGFNYIIDLVDGVISGINSISVAGFGVHIPLIPHLAKGGLIAQAGLALVGEQGPELVALPQGARVIPNNQIASFSQSSSQSGAAPIIHIHNYIDGKELTDNAMNRVIKSTRVSGPIRSNVS